MRKNKTNNAKTIDIRLASFPPPHPNSHLLFLSIRMISLSIASRASITSISPRAQSSQIYISSPVAKPSIARALTSFVLSCRRWPRRYSSLTAAGSRPTQPRWATKPCLPSLACLLCNSKQINHTNTHQVWRDVHGSKSQRVPERSLQRSSHRRRRQCPAKRER